MALAVTQTFLYCRPEVLENPLGAAEVDEVLERLACELKREHERELRFRPRQGNSIVIPEVGPDEIWAAMDRFLPIWKQARLFFLPRLGHR
jgi:hypothetical protein